MAIMGDDGFRGLNPGDAPRSGIMPRMPPLGGIGPIRKRPVGPELGPQFPSATAPAAQTPPPFGQANDPGAYGTPGAPGASPLGIWQNWLNTMGPYLAQLPGSQPGAETGGLSSLAPQHLAPHPTGMGMRGYDGGLWNRGFRGMML